MEKVETGSIVIITGEYLAAHLKEDTYEDRVFLSNGETAPDTGTDRKFWKLVEVIDFTA